MLRLEALPAGHGDCLLLEYGQGGSPGRILVDGGPAPTHKHLKARLEKLPDRDRRVDLLVVTHVDADHIAGIIKLLEDDDLDLSIGEIWFNGYRHLLDDGSESFGPVQGERLTTLIMQRELPWNASFRRSERESVGGPVVARKGEALPRITLRDQLKITVLGPTTEKLATMEPVWKSECQKAGLDPAVADVVPPEPAEDGIEAFGAPNLDALAASRFVEDGAPANGSSIALLVEFEGHRILLGGDAYPSTLGDAFKRGPDRAGPYELDLFKLAHHGSKANVSRELLEAVRCSKYLFSTNGSYFSHPDPEAVARVIRFGGRMPELLFNYRSSFTSPWAAFDGSECSVTYGEEGRGLQVELA